MPECQSAIEGQRQRQADRRWAYLAAASGLAPLRPPPSSLPSLLKVESEQVLEEECGLALVFFSEHKVTGWSGHAGCSWVAHTLPLIPAEAGWVRASGALPRSSCFLSSLSRSRSIVILTPTPHSVY